MRRIRSRRRRFQSAGEIVSEFGRRKFYRRLFRRPDREKSAIAERSAKRQSQRILPARHPCHHYLICLAIVFPVIKALRRRDREIGVASPLRRAQAWERIRGIIKADEERYLPAASIFRRPRRRRKKTA